MRGPVQLALTITTLSLMVFLLLLILGLLGFVGAITGLLAYTRPDLYKLIAFDIGAIFLLFIINRVRLRLNEKLLQQIK